MQNLEPIAQHGLPTSEQPVSYMNGSKAQFAALLGVSKRTLEQWEQGRRDPSGLAKTLIRVAELHPEVLREIAA